MIFGQKFNFFFTLVFFKIGLDMLFNVVVDTREGFPDYKNFHFYILSNLSLRTPL